mmetsp:Transcript_56232/g.127092  ORF Transcript_56232/g.127092 Transcript_56232/m.127092 type:complete len:330 (-) Transcript_56232:32-1021(-)
MKSSAPLLSAWIRTLAHFGAIGTVCGIYAHAATCPDGIREDENPGSLIQTMARLGQKVEDQQGETTSFDKAAATLLEPTPSIEGGTADLLSGCVDAYANGLDQVQLGLGQHIRGYPLIPRTTSPRSVVFSASPGTTGTSSLASALLQMNLTTAHHIELTPGDYWKWQDSITQCSDTSINDKQCFDCWRNFDYTTLPEEVDAAVDTPIDHVFLDLFMSFPSAMWILNTRPSQDWAKERVRQWPDSAPSIEHPCYVGQVKSYSLDQLALMLDLHNELVRCAVPTDRLFEYDIFVNGSYGLMHDLSIFLKRPEPLSVYASYPEVANFDLIGP